MSATSMVRHRVPSLSGDGTPSFLDPALSSDAFGSLELSAVLDVVADHAVGPLGAEAVRMRRPMDDTEWIRHELRLVGEVLSLLRRGERLEVVPVPLLRSALGRLRIAGSVLEINELAAIKATLAAGRIVAQELERVAEVAPHLATLPSATRANCSTPPVPAWPRRDAKCRRRGSA
jgi:dsDNA-specific endonuclease/ATPase MutS2